MLACTVLGPRINSFGREYAICVGMCFIILQQAGLSYLAYAEDTNTFLIISFIAQAIGGIGSGVNSTACMALVVSTSKRDERESNIGLVEAFTGIGFLAGPLFGSFMFTIGGYSMPFLSSAILYTATGPFVAYNLLRARRIRLEENGGSSPASSPRYKRIKVRKLFEVPRFVFGIAS